MAVLSKTQVNLKPIPGDGTHAGCARLWRTHYSVRKCFDSLSPCAW